MSSSRKVSDRAFGVSVGLVLCAIASLLWWRGHPTRASVIGLVGGALLVCGLAVPAILSTPHAIWWRASQWLGRISTAVLLTLIFLVALVPLSLVWQLTGKDPLQRRRRDWQGWHPYPASHRDPNHYQRMF